jgi:hypothetical protein
MAWKRSGASISRSMMKRHTRLLSALTSSYNMRCETADQGRRCAVPNLVCGKICHVVRLRLGRGFACRWSTVRGVQAMAPWQMAQAHMLGRHPAS